MLFTIRRVFIEPDVTKRSNVTRTNEELEGFWDVALRGDRWPEESSSAGVKGRSGVCVAGIKTQWRGAWVAQSVKRPSSAQVMILWFTNSSSGSGSILTAQSLELL